MSGLGERGTRLRRVAKELKPPPAIPPFYVQTPDERYRAVGWYLHWTRDGEPCYLGHSAIAAEVFLRTDPAVPRETKRVRKKDKKRTRA